MSHELMILVPKLLSLFILKFPHLSVFILIITSYYVSYILLHNFISFFFVLFFQYAIFLFIILLLELTAGLLGFIFKDWVSLL